MGGGGGGCSSLQAQYENWEGGGGGEGMQFASGPTKSAWGPLFGAQQIRYR